MVEETIREIRLAEKEADEIIKKAEKESETILAEAKKQAYQIRQEILETSNEGIRARSAEAKAEAEKNRAGAEQKIETEVQELKKSAAAREKEAISFVLSRLI